MHTIYYAARGWPSLFTQALLVITRKILLYLLNLTGGDVAALLKICLLVPAQPSPGPGPERRAADTVIERPETDDIVRSL